MLVAVFVIDAVTVLGIGELRDIKQAIDRASVILVADRRGLIRHANDRLCQVSRYERDELSVRIRQSRP
jgi:PAS domain-containing protein